MADDKHVNRNNQVEADKLRNKSSAIVTGMDAGLEKEDLQIKNIIQQTMLDTKKKLGERTNGNPINYFNEINFGNAFSELFVNKNGKKDKKDSEKLEDTLQLKQYMTDSNKVDISGLLMEDATRSLMFNNYRIINKHIPECAQALNIYKDNIMSPDDYTKLIFNVEYDKPGNDDDIEDVNEKLDDITLKYELEKKADSILSESLMLGESYLAVLSLENELNLMFKDGILNENNAVLLDKDAVSNTILSENVEVTEDDRYALSETLDLGDTILNETQTKELVARFINENVKIGSSKELLLERIQADYDKNKNGGTGVDIPGAFNKKEKSGKKKKDDNKPLYLNGSAIRRLVPDRLVELKIDDICYGYYYAEETTNQIPQSSYLGTTSGRQVGGALNLAGNNTISSTTGGQYTPATSAARELDVGENKMKLIADLFINGIAKKIDKEFVRNNKEFRDFIYDLVRQDYIIKKGLKLTYFKPDEVIKFECDPVYRDITFFAKLYLAILSNNLIIKLGRAHDKRVYYINVGADAQYEQAVSSTIQDIKTKDYKMEQLNDFNTLLRLSPGRFDDYFIPTINGERPVEIDTIAGMDVDMNNEFVEYLKNSMMSGMGVPRNLIDVTSEVDYARSISAMNSNFVRSVIRYQKALTPSFTRLYQILYKNEYRYNDDAEVESDVDISAIKVQFPSPATLNMSNMSEQIQAADANADFIASQIVIPKPDGSNEDLRLAMKREVLKDFLPGIDWDKYSGDILEKVKRDLEKEKIEQKANPAPADPSMGDPYGGGY